MGLLGLFDKLTEVEDLVDKVTPKVSLETFLGSVSDSVDKEIRRAEQEEGLFFLGGKMHISLSNDGRNILMRSEMFLQTSGGSFQKMEKSGSYPATMLNQDAYDSLVEEISQQGECILEISAP